MTSKRELRTFEEYLIERLGNQKKAQAYLEVVLENYYHDEDLDILIDALGLIAKAQGGSLKLVDKSKIDQGELDELLSEQSSLIFETVLDALGFICVPILGGQVPSYR